MILLSDLATTERSLWVLYLLLCLFPLWAIWTVTSGKLRRRK